jgi:hypothetical protein
MRDTLTTGSKSWCCVGSRPFGILTFVNTNGRREMLRMFKRTEQFEVEFCDRCSSVSTAADRREALLRQARDKAMAYGGRSA